MISLAVFLYVKRGTVYFRKPWRRLLESFEPDTPDNSTTVTATVTTSTTDGLSTTVTSRTSTIDIGIKANLKDSAVASDILEKASRKVLLRRSSQPTTNASKSIPVADVSNPSGRSPNNQSQVTTPDPSEIPIPQKPTMSSNTSSSTTISDARNLSANDETSAPTSSESVLKNMQLIGNANQPISNQSASTPLDSDASTLPGFLRSEVPPSEGVDEIAMESATTETLNTINSSLPASTEPTSSIPGPSATSTVANNEKISAIPQVPFEIPLRSRSKTTSPPSIDALSVEKFLLERVSSFNDVVRQRLEKLSSPTDLTIDDNGNATRLEQQGIDLPSFSWSASSLSMPTPEKRREILAKATSFIATALLVNTYFATGKFSFFWEDTLYAIAGLGVPMTVAMHRSLCVLLGHLNWVAFGSAILRIVVRPKFFGRDSKWFRQNALGEDETNGNANAAAATASQTPNRKSNNWIWWVIGGYSLSAWFFNIADFVNLYTLPAHILEDAILQEGVVTQLINPENNDFLASLVGYIAPCISAPWWEEVLYRGFFFPALSLFAPVGMSVFISGIVFSVHHLSITAGLPLAVLGWTWAGLYMASDNLWTTILVHALWNSRVFLSSWLGV